MLTLPDGGLGVAVKVAAGLLGAIWWTSGPGADEARFVHEVPLWFPFASLASAVFTQ